MDFLTTSFKISLKRIVKPPILFLAAFLFIALLIAAFVQRELALKVSIGVLYDKASEISEEIVGNISEFSNINMVVYDDLERLTEDVALAKLECAYVFGDNIENSIKNGNINDAVKLYKSKQTISDGFINELVFAALLKTASPYIASNYLYNQKKGDFKTLLFDNKERIGSYYEQDIFMHNSYEYTGEAKNPEASKSIAVGIVALFLFIYFFYTAIECISLKNSSVYTKLLRNQRFAYIFSNLTANALVMFMLVLIPCLLLQLKVFGVLLYIISLLLLALAVTFVFKNSDLIYSFFPILSLCAAVMGGVFIDLNNFSPLLGKIQYFFPTYYFVVYMQ